MAPSVEGVNASTHDAPDRRDAVVLLDIDGTLVDSTYLHALAWQRAFHREGVDLPFRDIHRTVGMGGDKLVGAVGGEDVEERLGDAIRDAWAEEFDTLSGEVRALPGAVDLVRDLAARGLGPALASSGEKKFAEEAVAVLGVADDIAVLTTNDDAQESKPEPDLVMATLAKVPADRAVLVGDTPYDVKSAAKAGIGCVAVRSGGYSDAELDGALAIVDQPGDLVGFDWDSVLRPTAG